MTTRDKSDARGKRTPGLIAGRWIEPRKPLIERSWFVKRLDRRWPKLRKSYCPQFEETMRGDCPKAKEWRSEIERIATDYVIRSELERTAPAHDPAMKWLKNIRYFATELAKTLERPINGCAKSIARSELHSHLNLREWGAYSSLDYAFLTPEERAEFQQTTLDEALLPPPTLPVEDFLKHVRSYADAADAAMLHMADEVCAFDGDAWDRWIAAMTAFCDRNGLPTEVSKESKFVEFIESLQHVLVEEMKGLFRRKPPRMSETAFRTRLNAIEALRRSSKNPGALAKAIQRARENVVGRIASQNAHQESAVAEE
jgi:hypothetical protein